MSKENPNELKIINKNERLKYINLLDKYKQQIADLEAKLAENRKWLASNEGFLENQKLKQQLVEKEQTIEEINKEFVQAVKDWKSLVEQKEKEIVELEEHDNLYHNQLAIEQLEKVKELMYKECECVGECYDENYYILYQHQIKKIFNNQIEQLKKGL